MVQEKNGYKKGNWNIPIGRGIYENNQTKQL